MDRQYPMYSYEHLPFFSDERCLRRNLTDNVISHFLATEKIIELSSAEYQETTCVFLSRYSTGCSLAQFRAINAFLILSSQLKGLIVYLIWNDFSYWFMKLPKYIMIFATELQAISNICQIFPRIKCVCVVETTTSLNSGSSKLFQ